MKYLLLFILLLISTNSFSQSKWAVFQQTITAAGLEGKKIRFSATIRVDAPENSFALLNIKVDRKDKQSGFSDNMEDRPVTDKEWKKYSIEGTIDKDADSIHIGGIGFGNGVFYFDDFMLEAETNGTWALTPLLNSGFESTEMAGQLPAGWKHMFDNPDFSYRISPEGNSGKYSLAMTARGMEEEKGIVAQLRFGNWIKQHYNKTEHQIPVRDGIKLYTNIYTPKDASATNKYPIVMNRTPYSIAPYGDQYASYIGPEFMVREKYIFVNQDVRGRYMSEGVWENMTPHKVNKNEKDVDESTDTYDVIDWLVKNISFNNGKVGQYGISYPGFYSVAGSINAHPALKAVSPQAPIADFYFDDFHHNGAFTQGYFWNFPIFGTSPGKPVKSAWYTLFDKPTPDAYDFYKRTTLKELGDKYYRNNFLWKQVTEHPDYDTFWQNRRIVKHVRNLKPAYLVVAGWYDAEDLYGVLTTYKEIEKNNPTTFNVITMGPFGHGDWAAEKGNHKHYQLYFGDSISTIFQRDIEAKFFHHFLKGKGDNEAGLPEAFMFNTGRKKYEQFSKWPPVNARKQKLYFSANEKLSFDKPSSGSHSEFISDPKKPVPYTMDIAGSFDVTPRNYMSEDQRFASSRPDVLVFETEPLTGDITIGGEISVRLNVSTTGTDADWIVKVIDVFPGDEKNSPYTDKGITLAGYQHMVRSEIMRSRYRNSFDKPVPMIANKITPVNFVLQDALHTFKKGHRIMVQVQSSWFPAFDLNPQKYLPNIYKASKKDFIKATHRVYHSTAAPSFLEVDVIP